MSREYMLMRAQQKDLLNRNDLTNKKQTELINQVEDIFDSMHEEDETSHAMRMYHATRLRAATNHQGYTGD